MRGFWNVMMLPILLFSCLMGGSAMSAPAGNLNVLADGERLQDRRMTDLKTHDTPWTFQKPASLDEWKNKRDRIRRKILISCGLWPMPESGQLKYEIFEKKENEDYTVEKVLLETFPGYYATGNLYRPKPDPANPGQRYPGVLCPHGHWTNARLAHTADDSVLAARSISFARQGYVCFAYDMVGYSDNKALLDHNFGGRREALWGIIPAGFQLYTSLKALDFLRSLPDVEPKRIACTGASGGGTQTFLLYAVDERIKAAAPVNMISAHMQGGCKCENAPQLRLDINNMDIGATMAPRPLMLVCATGDWTKNTPEVEYPAIRSIYELYRKPDLVAYHLVDAEHNYNKESRQAVYNWFARVFYHDRPQSDFVEKDYVMDPTPDLSVFAKHPIPEDALLTGPLEPTNQWYAIAKIAGIKLCQAYRRQYGCDFNAAMPTNLYGPNDNFDLKTSHVLPALIRKAHEAKLSGLDHVTIWGTGSPRREFLFSEDCADALVFLLKNYEDYEHVNVGSGEDIAILDLMRLVAEVVGFKGRIETDPSKPDGTPRKLMSNAKLAAMGWKPTTELRDGIARAYRWHLDTLKH